MNSEKSLVPTSKFPSLVLRHQPVVVAPSDKKGFAVNDDGHRNCANQARSLCGVDLKISESMPPATLYQGAVAAFTKSSRSIGLEKRSRNHVHLSADEATATKVGSRRGKPVLLRVDAAAMYRQGHRLFSSVNGVWLSDQTAEG